MKTILTLELDAVRGGYNKAAAKESGQNWGTLGAFIGAPLVGTYMGLNEGYQGGWGGTGIGGIAGYGIGYGFGYAKKAWQTRGQK